MCQTTNPASTGQAGPAFETLVGVAFLATLLARGAPLGLSAGTLDAVHLQAGHLGRATEDFLLEATSPSGQTIVSILQTDTDSPPDSTEIWRFLRRFQVYDLDFETSNGLAETMIRSILMASLPNGDARLAEATWNELIVASLRSAGAAASYLREQLPDSVLQRHTRLTGFSEGVSIVGRHRHRLKLRPQYNQRRSFTSPFRIRVPALPYRTFWLTTAWTSWPPKGTSNANHIITSPSTS